MKVHKLITLRQAAEYLDVTPATMASYVRNGKIPSHCLVQVGTRRKIKLQPFLDHYQLTV